MQAAGKSTARRNLAAGIAGPAASSPASPGLAPANATNALLGGILEALRFMGESYAAVVSIACYSHEPRIDFLQNNLNAPVWFDEADSGRGSDPDQLSDPPASDEEE